MMAALGSNYAKNVRASTLSSKKRGKRVALSNDNRYICFQNPSINIKLNNAIINDIISGGECFPPYSKRDTVNFKCSVCLECTRVPSFQNPPSTHEHIAIIEIPFKSHFTEDKKFVNNDAHVYLSHPEYKTDKFLQQHKFAFLARLFGAYEIFKSDEYIVKSRSQASDKNIAKFGSV